MTSPFSPVFGLGELWQFTREHSAGERARVTYLREGELLQRSGLLTAP